MTSKSDDELKASWEILRGPLPELADPATLFPDRNAGDFVLGTHTGRIILRITKEGKVQLGPGVDLDEASELFWTNLALKRVGMEERLLHLGLLEQVLIQAGTADLAYETAQVRAHSPGATEHDRLMEELAQRSLEIVVHNLVEFARGLVQRPAPSRSEEDV
jgi:hypothetical protein